MMMITTERGERVPRRGCADMQVPAERALTEVIDEVARTYKGRDLMAAALLYDLGRALTCLSDIVDQRLSGGA